MRETRGCPACGRKSETGASFCPYCGTALGIEARGAAAREGERRQLTVAFCDLVGSTELSTRLDPEDFGELIHRYQRIAVAAASRYGGGVENYLGDGIVFRFGWPEAHDDDPERAVRAALEIVDELESEGDELRVRVGIHTGLAVIGELGGAESPETMALGETLNIAARLQGLAPPGGVVISDATARLVAGIFATEELGPQALKGIEEPVVAHAVLETTGVRSRLDAARGTLTPFINREAEGRMLFSRWDLAAAGTGQTVILIGEPGVGKSRLAYELREQLNDSSFTWLECRCTAYTQGTALRPAVELIEVVLGLADDDSEDGTTRLERLRSGLEVAGIETEEATALLATLLSIDGLDAPGMSAELQRRRTIEVLGDWLLGLARHQPLALLVEDLHWADPSSLELFGELIARGRDAPLLLVGTAREGFAPPWGARPTVTALSLATLGEEHTRDVVRAVAGEREIPKEALDRIAVESGGVPLYAEEVSRALLESDALVERNDRLELSAPLVELDVPMTLQGSLMARLDRLSAAKPVAKLASVCGREFSFALVSAVADLDDPTVRAGLERLINAEILFARGHPPNATYTFKHALIQETAYESLLRSTRRRLHARVAYALESGIDPATAIPETIARHNELAARTEKAIHGYLAAAEEASLRSGSTVEAIDHLRHAIYLVPQLSSGRHRDELEVDAQMALGSAIIAARNYADPEIEVAYGRALELCEGLGDDSRVAYALIGLSIHYSNRGDLAHGSGLALRALAIAERDDDPSLELLGRVELALPLILQGRFAESLEEAERAVELYVPERDRRLADRFGTDHGVAARCFVAWSSIGVGDLGGALESARDAERLAREVEHPFSIAYALVAQGTIHWALGELTRMEEAGDAAAAIGAEQGFDFWAGLGRVLKCSSQILRTGEEGLLDELTEASLVAGETGNIAGAPPILACVAQAQAAAGRRDQALATLDGAVAVSAETGQTYWDSELARIRARLILESGGPGAAKEAEAELRRALATARSIGFALHELLAALELAELRGGEDEELGAIIAGARARLRGADRVPGP